MAWAALAAVVAVLVVQVVRSRRTIAALTERLADASRNLEALQHAFGRFAPAEVVDEIARGAPSRPERKEITVLFVDLRGFTPLAEQLDPAALVRLLNGWFDRMSRTITAHRGHVAKFIGDGIMAVFGALEANPWHTDDAAHAALGIRAALAEYNVTLARDGLPALAAGVGIHRGPVTAGLMGSAALIEYGVIGSTVNVAARVERLTRALDAPVLVTEAARAALDRRFRLRPMPPATVKGIAGTVATFALDGFDGG